MRLTKVLGGAFCAVMLLCMPLKAQELTVWHDLGDNGIKWFQGRRRGIRQGQARCHRALALLPHGPVVRPGDRRAQHRYRAGPDLQQLRARHPRREPDRQGHGHAPVLAGITDKGFLADDDLKVATFKGKMIILPVQRVQMALGVRKSWLDKTGEISRDLGGCEAHRREIPRCRSGRQW